MIRQSIRPSKTCWPIAGACSIALAWGCIAAAQTPNTTMPQTTPENKPAAASHDAWSARRGDEARDAIDHVNDAVRVVQRMKSDPGMASLLQQARGVFVIPEYGRAAFGVGGRGGAGVLLTKQDGTWSQPSFYSYGGISAGLQAGAEGGSIAFVLNNDKAVNSFTKQDNNWSLNAEAGLTVVAWSKKAQGSAGKGDVTVWSDSKGLFGDAAISLTDINFDEAETGAYYGQKVSSARDVINGKLQNPHSAALRNALAQAPAAGTYEGRSKTMSQ
jgi:lipid-binding SYLF domain-containing protein